MIIPANGYILVKVKKLETRSSGLVVAKNDQQQEYGTVVSSGDTEYKKGQTIYFKSYSAIPITIEKEELFFIKEDEVIAYE